LKANHNAMANQSRQRALH